MSSGAYGETHVPAAAEGRRRCRRGCVAGDHVTAGGPGACRGRQVSPTAQEGAAGHKGPPVQGTEEVGCLHLKELVLAGVEIYAEKFFLFHRIVSKGSTCPTLFLPVPDCARYMDE